MSALVSSGKGNGDDHLDRTERSPRTTPTQEDEPATLEASLHAIHALCLSSVTKLAVLEGRSAVWDDTVYGLQALHATTQTLSTATLELHRRVRPLGRLTAGALLLGGSFLGSAAGALVLWWVLH